MESTCAVNLWNSIAGRERAPEGYLTGNMNMLYDKVHEPFYVWFCIAKKKKKKIFGAHNTFWLHAYVQLQYLCLPQTIPKPPDVCWHRIFLSFLHVAYLSQKPRHLYMVLLLVAGSVRQHYIEIRNCFSCKLQFAFKLFFKPKPVKRWECLQRWGSLLVYKFG